MKYKDARSRKMNKKSRSPFLYWLSIQELKRPQITFLLEWLSLFSTAWLFWWVMFFGGRGSLAPAITASAVSALYATCLIYGRMLRVTGCRKCSNPLPFMRREVARRHVDDHEECIDEEFNFEWEQPVDRVRCRMVRTEMVMYRCRKCDQAWEEKVELPVSNFKPMQHIGSRK